MKRQASTLLALCLLVSLSGLAPAQQGQTNGQGQASTSPRKAQAPKKAEKPAGPPPEQKIGFLFDLSSILSGVDSYGDGYQAGLGFVWKIGPNFSLRALGALDLTSANGQITSAFGLGAAPIWILSDKKVSPYLGALGGFRLTSAPAPVGGANHLYGGLLGGVEMAVWENISLFAEYKLIFGNDANTYILKLGPEETTTAVTTTTGGGPTTTSTTETTTSASSALLGIIIYF